MKSTYSYNSNSKLLWLICLALLFIATLGNIGNIGNSAFFTLLIIFFGLSILAFTLFTSKVIFDGNKVTSKNFFSEKTSAILPTSKIYIKKNITRYQFFITVKTYQIRIITNKKTHKINANMDYVETLFDEIATLEANIIFPEYIDTFNEVGEISFGRIIVTQKGFCIGKKTYPFNAISIEINNGQLNLRKAGRFTMVTVKSIAISDIPNLQSFLNLLNQLTS